VGVREEVLVSIRPSSHRQRPAPWQAGAEIEQLLVELIVKLLM
jgi:hypothetical protein